MTTEQTPRRRHLTGLGFRLGLLIAVILPLSVGGVMWRFMEAQKENLVREAIHGVERLSDALVLGIRHSLLRNHREDIQEMISSIAKAPEVEAVRLIDKDGEVKYSSIPSEIGRRVNMEEEACVICHARSRVLSNPGKKERARIFPGEGGMRYMGFITPVRNEPACVTAACHAHVSSQKILGVLDVKVSLAGIDSEARLDRGRFFGFMAAWIAVLAIAAAVAGRRYLTRPIRELARACEELSERGAGDPLPRLDTTGLQELEALATAFQVMAKRLTEAQADLEWKVEERTRQLNEAEEQILRSEKLAAMGVLAAGIAHELNNPLTGVITFSHVLLRKTDPQSPDAVKLKRIVSEAERCARIIDGLLRFARPLPEGTDLRRVESVIEDTLALIQPQEKYQRLEITLHLEKASQVAQVSASGLQQVLLNLLKNAAEAGARRISITASSATKPEEMILVVEDDGSGIPPESLPKIFDPFFTTKDVGEGAGLGLWMCYRIVTELHGSITAENRVEGGVRFRVRLPVVINNT